jgi:hypothetical protein
MFSSKAHKLRPNNRRAICCIFSDRHGPKDDSHSCSRGLACLLEPHPFPDSKGSKIILHPDRVQVSHTVACLSGFRTENRHLVLPLEELPDFVFFDPVYRDRCHRPTTLWIILPSRATDKFRHLIPSRGGNDGTEHRVCSRET